MTRTGIIVFLFLGLLPPAAPGQVVLSGQTAAQFYKSAVTQSPRAVDGGRPSFGWDTRLFVEGEVTDHVSALANVRATNVDAVTFDYIAIRITDVTPLGLNFQAGKFDLPFGNLGERRFPRKNILYGLPSIYEYHTALPDHFPPGPDNKVIPERDIIAGAGLGRGMRLLDLGMYHPGAMVYGSAGILDYAFAVTTGTVSTSIYSSDNYNSDLGKVARLAITPLTGLTLGGAYSWGAYMQASYPIPGNESVTSYTERAAEADLEFSRGHAVIDGEVVYASYSVPVTTDDQDLTVLGYYVEGKYTLMPRLYAALRVSGLQFGNILADGVGQPWDYNLVEWEGGLGFFIDRDVLLKAVRRETRIRGGSGPKDNLTVLQLVVAY
ncbi:MAG TPA: hypothetical protein VMF59_15700 [Bacteroidota bacterium]|nr:hypothetical protein [Bacteroidota bacterium]